MHVSKSTYEQLGDTFEVEPGNGGTRDNYLEMKKIITYFIIDKVINYMYMYMYMLYSVHVHVIQCACT